MNTREAKLKDKNARLRTALRVIANELSETKTLTDALEWIAAQSTGQDATPKECSMVLVAQDALNKSPFKK